MAATVATIENFILTDSLLWRRNNPRRCKTSAEFESKEGEVIKLIVERMWVVMDEFASSSDDRYFMYSLNSPPRRPLLLNGGLKVRNSIQPKNDFGRQLSRPRTFAAVNPKSEQGRPNSK